MRIFMRAGCGCIFLESDTDKYVIVESCDGDSDHPWFRNEMNKDDSYIRPENLKTAKYLTEENQREMLDEMNKLMSDGFKFRNLKKILS